MTNVTITCDRCHQPIEAGRVKLVCDTPASPGIGSAGTGERPTLDLCVPCAQALVAWLRAGSAPKTT
jgi:hypothetical protein